MNVLAVCNNSSMMQSILFVKNIINIIFIVVPIVLALLFTIDLAKNVFSKDDQENQKNLKLGIKRIIYSLILLFIPLLVKTFMSMIQDYSKIANCYTIATEENVKEAYRQEQINYNNNYRNHQNDQNNNRKQVRLENKQNKKENESLVKKILKALKKENKNQSIVDANYSDIDSITKYTKSNGKVAQATSAGGRYDGKNGDQSGKEVSKNRGAPSNASYIVRFKDPKKAEIAARCAEAGAENDKIGYSVKDYTSLYYEAKKVNWDLSKIKHKCTTVCSAFVSVCINATGTKITKHLNGFGNNESRFKSIDDFKVIKPYRKSKLMRGDIIVHECPGQCGHMSMAR